jgi:hypothetical protein
VLDRWSGALDWPTLVARSSRWRIRRALFFALRRLADFFTLPDAATVVSASLTPRGPRAAAARWLVAHRADRLRTFEHADLRSC